MEMAKILCALLLVCGGGLSLLQGKSLKGSRPNIILVLTDDQGMGDLSGMGNQILNTPHMDRFGEQSVRFNQFMVSPTCAPTRSALMSGQAPFKVGVTHTIFQRERMALDVFTLPQALKSVGYRTGLFGKWHLGDEEEYLPQSRGFDEVLMHGAGGIGQTKYGDFPVNQENTYFDNTLLHNDTIVKTKGFCTDLFFQAGLAWIEAQMKSEDPYFAYISLNAPHSPYIAPGNYTKRFLDMGYDAKTAGRYGMIENIDDNLGAMMAKLQEWDALENTLVIFMSDNGMANGFKLKLDGETIMPHNAGLNGVKNSPHEGGNHVPAYWSWKGTLESDVDVEALSAHLDLYPTFCDLAGVSTSVAVQGLDGRSMLPLLEDSKAEMPDRNVFVHRGRWKEGQREKNKYIGCAVRTQRWRFVNGTELYDLRVDPGEKQDVAARYPEVFSELRSAYDSWWDEVVPLMVNEGLPTVKPEDQPFAIRYDKQLKEMGIPKWDPATAY